MFFGSIVAAITPFKQGKIDLSAFQKVIEHLIQGGSHGIVVAGSTGEGTLLSFEEREELLHTAIHTSSGRVPIIAGCSAASTRESLNLVDQAELLGCSAVLVTPPCYVKPTQKGVIEHYKHIYAHTTIPIIVYNHPGRTGTDITPETIFELAKIPTVVGLKDSHPDLTRVLKFKNGIESLKKQGQLPETKPFSLLIGDSPFFAPYLTLGGDGCISVTANAYPKLSSMLYKAWLEKDMVTFEKIRDQLAPFDDLIGIEVNPTPIKYMMHKLGLCENEFRLPLLPISKSSEQLIDVEMAKLAEQFKVAA